jgi:hypothetical protein
MGSNFETSSAAAAGGINIYNQVLTKAPEIIANTKAASFPASMHASTRDYPQFRMQRID